MNGTPADRLKKLAARREAEAAAQLPPVRLPEPAPPAARPVGPDDLHAQAAPVAAPAAPVIDEAALRELVEQAVRDVIGPIVSKAIADSVSPDELQGRVRDALTDTVAQMVTASVRGSIAPEPLRKQIVRIVDEVLTPQIKEAVGAALDNDALRAQVAAVAREVAPKQTPAVDETGLLERVREAAEEAIRPLTERLRALERLVTGGVAPGEEPTEASLVVRTEFLGLEVESLGAIRAALEQIAGPNHERSEGIADMMMETVTRLVVKALLNDDYKNLMATISEKWGAVTTTFVLTELEKPDVVRVEIARMYGLTVAALDTPGNEAKKAAVDAKVLLVTRRATELIPPEAREVGA